MGEVYRARDTKLARDVAVKVLPADLSRDDERLARFEKEARTASSLSHPNIVTIYEIGSANATSFMAMELVEGKTLREALSSGPLGPKKVLSLAAQIADGLARAHAAGIVHRDLKPENVMVTRDGLVKILDFGLAKLIRRGFVASGSAENPTVTRATEAGTVLGTVGYMSPEQASGEPLDFRSDQFSLGVILYEMVAGRRAFDRPTSAQTLAAIIEDEPESLAAAAPKTSEGLVGIVERCLAKDPEDRYGSTKDLARDLASLRDRSSGVSPAGVAAPGSRRLRVSRAAVVASAAALATAVLITFLSGERMQAARDRHAPPPRRTVLTFGQGFLTGARFTSDGKTVVYSAAWDGRPSEIFTTRVGSVDSRSLGISDAWVLAVSSTGEMALALGCDRRGNPCQGTLARAPLAGGPPREVLHSVMAADWSPDGRELAVSLFDRLEYPIGKVLARAQPNGFISSVRVSPDGKLVAFLDHPRVDSERAIVTVVDRAGTRRIVSSEWAGLGPILWSPTGDEIFFAPLGRREIRGMNLSAHTRATPWIPALDDVSREGLFLETGMLSDGYRGVVRGLVPSAPEERNLSWLARAVAADLSVDGQQLLLYDEGSRFEGGGEETFKTFLRPTDGSDATPLGDGRALALSPDQQWALVVQGSPRPHLALLPTGAGDPVPLAGGGQLYRRGTFFPDGKRILFNIWDEKREMRSFVQDVPGGTPKPIGDAGVWLTVVSPDGKLVAGGEGEGHVIYAADGSGGPRPIAGTKPRDAFVRWNTDGRTIDLSGADEYPMTLYRLDLATGRRERWKTLSPPDGTGFVRYGPRLRGPGVSVTPDEKYYAYTYFIDSSRLVLVDAGPEWWK
jgi:hypothetical protein